MVSRGLNTDSAQVVGQGLCLGYGQRTRGELQQLTDVVLSPVQEM